MYGLKCSKWSTAARSVAAMACLSGSSTNCGFTVIVPVRCQKVRSTSKFMLKFFVIATHTHWIYHFLFLFLGIRFTDVV